MSLAIAPDVVLSDDYITKVVAIIAQRRKGKTYTASLLAEEMVVAGLPWVALDPTGAWWGLRSSADGLAEGLPVVVIGGQHGHVPLSSHMGLVVADLVLDHPGWYVIDLSGFDTRTEERRFAYEFADRLYRRKGQAGMDFPLHLFVDEADMFAPQERESGDQKMLGAFQAIVRRGGLRGLGCTLITQRPALLNKSVLTQLDMLILLRLVAGNDQDAVDDNYIKRQATKELRADLMGSMAGLGIGEGWVWEPGAEPTLLVRTHFRPRRTFNSSATPKPGEQRVEPSVFATVDLDALTAAFEEEIVRAERDDPDKLRAEMRLLQAHVADLEHEKADLMHQLATRPAEVEVTVEKVPVLDDAALERLEHAIKATEQIGRDLTDYGAGIMGHSAEIVAALRRHAPTQQGTEPRTQQGTEPAPISQSPSPAAPKAGTGEGTPEVVRLMGNLEQSLAAAKVERTPGGPTDTELRLLTALAQFGPLPINRLAVLTGLKPSSKHVSNVVSAMRTKGWVSKGQPVEITTEGHKAMPGTIQALPTGHALVDWWLDKLPGTQGKVLLAYLQEWPRPVAKAVVAGRTGLDPESKHISNVISSLRSYGLLEGLGDDTKAVDDLGAAARP